LYVMGGVYVFVAFLTVQTAPKHTFTELEAGKDGRHIKTARECAARVGYDVISIEEEDRGLRHLNSWAKVHATVTDPSYFRKDRPVTRVYVTWSDSDLVMVLVGHGPAYGYIYPDPFIQWDLFRQNTYPRQIILHPLAIYNNPAIH
jgi:hypothetical protein